MQKKKRIKLKDVAVFAMVLLMILSLVLPSLLSLLEIISANNR